MPAKGSRKCKVCRKYSVPPCPYCNKDLESLEPLSKLTNSDILSNTLSRGLQNKNIQHVMDNIDDYSSDYCKGLRERDRIKKKVKKIKKHTRKVHKKDPNKPWWKFWRY